MKLGLLISDVTVKGNCKRLGVWSKAHTSALNDMFLGKHEPIKVAIGGNGIYRVSSRPNGSINEFRLGLLSKYRKRTKSQ